MAGVASQLALAVEDVVVQRHGHNHHASRDVLFAFVVRIKMADHVAVAATDAESDRNIFHRGMNLVGGNTLENFNLLIKLFGRLALHISGEWRGIWWACCRGLRVEVGWERAERENRNGEHSKDSGCTAHKQILVHTLGSSSRLFFEQIKIGFPTQNFPPAPL